MSLRDVTKEKLTYEQQHTALAKQAQDFQEKLRLLEEKREMMALGSEKKSQPSMKAWERVGKKEERHVSFEIPAGTVLKAVLVSGADCSVAVNKPTGPNMMLLRPLDNGQLPRNVRVPLKGSVILGNAIGDISSERVYIRGERMTLVEKGGSFIETEVSAYVSGEDGREGMRGVVVDRSGKIVQRAAFAAFLQGIGQGFQAMIDTNVVKNMAEKTKDASFIVNSDMVHPIQQGTGTAFGKLTDYYIKRSEQLQPTIQIAAGRVVDVVFTKSVKIGEKDLKKKLDMQRAAKGEEK
jgi:conjugal transfer pilus assembly protein TraB